MSEKYRQAGVDIEAGYESVRLIKSHVARTKVLGAVDSICAFGGMFDFRRTSPRCGITSSLLMQLTIPPPAVFFKLSVNI